MFKVIVFDFDGVILESVDIKTRAFARLFQGEAPEIVQQIVEYHLKNGGISRFDKFRTIYRDILKRPLSDKKFQFLCKQFARVVVDEVVDAPWVEGAQEFLLKHEGRYMFFVVSGTPEEELKEIIHRRGMEKFFIGILGSPMTKNVLLHDLMSRQGLYPFDVVFVGDTETDWIAARQAQVEFIFRRVSDDAQLIGFTGPSIRSLSDLDECLTTLKASRIPPT